MLDLKNIDRTRAFTPEEQEEVNKLPNDQRYEAMARPNSAETMTYEERQKHYRSSNYPEVRYGPGKGTASPPKGKRG